jgi:hypothetical protein
LAIKIKSFAMMNYTTKMKKIIVKMAFNPHKAPKQLKGKTMREVKK